MHSHKLVSSIHTIGQEIETSHSPEITKTMFRTMHSRSVLNQIPEQNIRIKKAVTGLDSVIVSRVDSEVKTLLILDSHRLKDDSQIDYATRNV